MPRGYTTPTTSRTTSTYPARRAPRAAPERASGLNQPRGVRVGWGGGRHAAATFPYLRSFWPGPRNPLKGVPGKCWIGSRARAPLGPWDVSDLERLSSGCGRSRIRRRRSRIRRRRDAGSGSFVAGSGCRRTSRLGPPESDKVDGFGASRIRRRRRRIRRRHRRIRLLRRRIRLVRDPGYPTLPGSAPSGPSGPKERLFWPESRLFWPKAGIHGNTREYTEKPAFGQGRSRLLAKRSRLLAKGRSRLLARKKPASSLKEPASGQKKPAFWPKRSRLLAKKKPAFWPKRSRLLAKKARWFRELLAKSEAHFWPKVASLLAKSGFTFGQK